MGCVYVATNKVNGKQYVGKTILTLAQRKRDHLRNATKGVRWAFYRALRKYGSDAFEWAVLFEGESDEQLKKVEKLFIIEMGTKSPNGYNLTDGGEGSAGFVHSEESRAKISKAQIGKKLSPSHVANVSKGLKGRKLSSSHRASISKAQMGRKQSPSTRMKMSKAHTGKKLSSSHRAKISKKLKGRKLSSLHRLNMGWAQRRYQLRKRRELLKGV